MKRLFAAIFLSTALILGAQARGEPEPARTFTPKSPRVDWAAWTRPLASPNLVVQPAKVEAAPAEKAAPVEAQLPLDDVDVVDAHWMALTMWGEARSQGDAGMRAVGHVIRNRWLAQRHGAFVTDTVSEAWQFSCWNAGDPNRSKMLNIEDLPKASRDYRLWQEAKQLSAEILAGRSADPTGGALFYHTTDVHPSWSAGIAPVTQIGNHLFFLAAR